MTWGYWATLISLYELTLNRLYNSRYVEAFVAVLVTINFRYKAGVSYRITGLP